MVPDPTGSKKTTTRQSQPELRNINSLNSMTVEYMIEYYLYGIGHTQWNTKVDLSFARGLRAILSQDSDVVMVDEIRDLETAEIAVQASLTGHLVLSTLHTNTAVGAVTRLRDMGVEPFLLSSSLIGVVAQRLVRVLEPATKVPYTASEYECNLLKADINDPPTLYHAAEAQSGTAQGYHGRTGIYELVSVDDELRRMIHDGAGEHELEAHARKHSPSIRQEGLTKVQEGFTTLEEVLRVTQAD